MKGRSDFRHWDDLSPDVLALIFDNLEFRELLQVIPLVCKSWCKVVEGPYWWQRIDVDNWSYSLVESPEKLHRMLQKLIKRSSGSLLEFIFSGVEDHQLLFIADHAGSLQTLDISHSHSISESTVERVASKFASLTTLDISGCDQVGSKALEAIGRNCKNLMSLSFAKSNTSRSYKASDAEEVRTIARTLPKLKHLTVAFENLKTQDVIEILSGFPKLELLNIDCCLEADLDGKLLEEKYPKVKVTSMVWGSDLAFSSDESDDDGSVQYDWLGWQQQLL